LLFVETDLPCKGKLQRLKSQLLWTSLFLFITFSIKLMPSTSTTSTGYGHSGVSLYFGEY